MLAVLSAYLQTPGLIPFMARPASLTGTSRLASTHNEMKRKAPEEKPVLPNRHKIKMSLLKQPSKEAQQHECPPNFKPSGILDEDAKLKGLTSDSCYTEPTERTEPNAQTGKYRLYAFQDTDEIDTTQRLDKRSMYIIGSGPKVDISLLHESVSEEHCVLQFLDSPKPGLYIIDLDSIGGVRINGDSIKPQTYVELKSKDTVRVGTAGTEYLVIEDSPRVRTQPKCA